MATSKFNLAVLTCARTANKELLLYLAQLCICLAVHLQKHQFADICMHRQHRQTAKAISTEGRGGGRSCRQIAVAEGQQCNSSKPVALAVAAAARCDLFNFKDSLLELELEQYKGW